MRSSGVTSWLRLARAHQLLARAFSDHLRGHGLSPAQFDVLVHVGDRPGLTQQELAERLLVTKGNVCQILGRMEVQGLITRQPEGRAKRVDLTPAGERLYAEVIPAHEARVEEILGALSSADQATLRRLLRAVERAV